MKKISSKTSPTGGKGVLQTQQHWLNKEQGMPSGLEKSEQNGPEKVFLKYKDFIPNFSKLLYTKIAIFFCRFIYDDDDQSFWVLT